MYKLWPIGARCFKEPDVCLMTHVIYIQNISDDETISTFSLFSSRMQAASLPKVYDLLFFNIMTVIRANT